jgi:hypothetical protein
VAIVFLAFNICLEEEAIREILIIFNHVALIPIANIYFRNVSISI